MSETIYKCKCKSAESGFVKIDDKNTNLVCGIRGVVDQGNIRLTNSIVTCAICGATIYEDKESGK